MKRYLKICSDDILIETTELYKIICRIGSFDVSTNRYGDIGILYKGIMVTAVGSSHCIKKSIIKNIQRLRIIRRIIKTKGDIYDITTK